MGNPPVVVALLLVRVVVGLKEGYEYVLVLSVVSLALGVLGPGRFSLDNLAGSEITGWAGGGIALGVAVVAVAGMLATFYRPQPAATPTVVDA